MTSSVTKPHQHINDFFPLEIIDFKKLLVTYNERDGFTFCN